MHIPTLLFDLSRTLVRFAPKYGLSVIGLMWFRSLTAGLGLLLIIPLLDTIGVHSLNAPHGQLTTALVQLFSWLHVSLCLENILLLFLCLMTIIAVGHFLEDVMRDAWQERYIYHLRHAIYSALLGSRWEFFIKNKHADLLHGVTAQLQASWLCHYQWLQIINQCILILVYISLDFFASWKMTLIASGFALILLNLMRPLHRMTSRRSVKNLTRNQVLFQAFYEQLNAFKIAKSSHNEAILLKKVLAESVALQQQSRQFTLLRAGSKGLYKIISTAAFISLVYVALQHLHLPMPIVLLLILTFSRILPAISSLQQSYQQLLNQLPMYENLKKLLRNCQANQEVIDIKAPINFKRSIRLENVSFRYHADQPWVLQDLSMQLQKHTTTVLVGPSGSGKTTMVDLLLGLLRPTQGKIKIDDTQLTEQFLPAWRKKIAYVPQDSFLFNTSIRENLLIFCRTRPSDAAIEDALHLVAASTFIKALPQGIDTIIGDRGIYLSGGERQRIALARAILMQPELLILDESTNALDDKTIATIQQALERLHGKMTILIISHQWKMQAFADIVINLTAVQQGQENAYSI